MLECQQQLSGSQKLQHSILSTTSLSPVNPDSVWLSVSLTLACCRGLASWECVKSLEGVVQARSKCATDCRSVENATRNALRIPANASCVLTPNTKYLTTIHRSVRQENSAKSIGQGDATCDSTHRCPSQPSRAPRLDAATRSCRRTAQDSTTTCVPVRQYPPASRLPPLPA